MTVRKGFNRYIEDIARRKKLPLHGNFELTPLCNLDCKMCYVHLTGSQFSMESLISIDQWKKSVETWRGVCQKINDDWAQLCNETIDEYNSEIKELYDKFESEIKELESRVNKNDL